jgi:hypothetical protein
MSKIEKQAFLRENIKGQGLDSDKFIKFLEESEDKETDLDNWTLEELQRAVKKFKKAIEEDSDDESVSSASSGVETDVFGKEEAV